MIDVSGRDMGEMRDTHSNTEGHHNPVKTLDKGVTLVYPRERVHYAHVKGAL